MAQVTITINFREYGIACDDGQEARILKLARILDEKAQQLTAGGGQINENMLLAMSGLLLADDLLEARQQQNKNITQAAPAIPEPVVKTVEKIVEKVVEPDWHAIDAAIAGALNEAAENIVRMVDELKEL